jgi:hypothetical protein
VTLSYAFQREKQSREWTSQTSSGKCWSLLFRLRLKEKMGGKDPGEILAMS